MSTEHRIEIQEISPVAFAVPGIRKVCQHDTVYFKNSTTGTIKIRVASDEALEELKEKDVEKVHTGKESKRFTVIAKSGTYEFSVHYSYWDKRKKRRRTGFAIGASSPKIIIVR